MINIHFVCCSFQIKPNKANKNQLNPAAPKESESFYVSYLSFCSTDPRLKTTTKSQQ